MCDRSHGTYVDTFGSGKVQDDILEDWLYNHIDLRPLAIIERLQLRNPYYARTAAYGHFGRDEFPWERISDDLIVELNSLCSRAET